MDADVSHVMTQMSPGDITNAAHVFEAATGEYIHDPPSAEAEATVASKAGEATPFEVGRAAKAKADEAKARAEQQAVSWGSRLHTRDPSEQPHCHLDRLESVAGASSSRAKRRSACLCVCVYVCICLLFLLFVVVFLF